MITLFLLPIFDVFRENLYNWTYWKLPAGHVPQDNWVVSMLSPLQAVPPFASWVEIVRTLFLVPVPQVTLQVDQVDQLAHAQLTTGHVPQFTWEVSALSPLQAVPPFCSWTDILRCLVLVPVPQVALHVDQADQFSHAQFTGVRFFNRSKFRSF